MSKLRISIIGGGVAGMSAAHELIERGLSTTVYEFRDAIGGKARSVAVQNTAKNGRKNLPGEHGFRFFPGFYKHITDTMKRIPYKDNPEGVFNNLVETKNNLFSYQDSKDYKVPNSITNIKTWREFKELIRAFYIERFGLTENDIDEYAKIIWQLLTSSDERRDAEYEQMSLADLLGDRKRSKNFNMLLMNAPRILVAAKPNKASMKTIGRIQVQLLLDLVTPGRTADRVLNGPTNDVWLTPWKKYLESKGVKFVLEAKAKSIEIEDKQISNVILEQDGKEIKATADYFILAAPIERAIEILNREIYNLAPSLKGMPKLSKKVEWMNGIQFYLKEDVDIVEGHTIYAGTPWALTSISQKQFWEDTDLADYGDGEVKGILSVVISDWEKKGIKQKKPARECTPDEIKDEVWYQIKRWINDKHNVLLKDEDLHSWFLDYDIEKDTEPASRYRNKNAEPLLVNEVGTWKLRPEATTEIDNLFLASDYVRTNTDLATMEAANEAARRAVNGIIENSGLRSKPCKIWELEEPFFLKPFKMKDKRRWEKGLPWKGDLHPKPSTISRLLGAGEKGER